MAVNRCLNSPQPKAGTRGPSHLTPVQRVSTRDGEDTLRAICDIPLCREQGVGSMLTYAETVSLTLKP